MHSLAKTFGISEKSYDLLIRTLKECLEVERVVVFGSRAMGNHKRGSDIDLALFGDGLNAKITADLSAQLNERLPIPYMIDLVDYTHLDNVSLKQHIDSCGKDLVAKD